MSPIRLRDRHGGTSNSFCHAGADGSCVARPGAWLDPDQSCCAAPVINLALRRTAFANAPTHAWNREDAVGDNHRKGLPCALARTHCGASRRGRADAAGARSPIARPRMGAALAGFAGSTSLRTIERGRFQYGRKARRCMSRAITGVWVFRARPTTTPMSIRASLSTGTPGS